MTNLPPKGNADSMDNVAVTREEFRQDIGEFLEFSAQALGGVGGSYTTESVDPLAVVLQGTPTLAAGAEPPAADDSLRIANTRWVRTVAGVASPWQRSGTEIVPDNNGDSVRLNDGTGTETIRLSADGSATFAGTVQSSAFISTNVGWQLGAGGAIVAKRIDNASNPVFRGYFSNTENFTVTASGNATFAGNVGIGTAVSGSALNVVGNEIRFSNSVNVSYYGAISHDANASGNNFYDVQDAGGHVFRLNGLERARLDSAGRLLVGTATARTNIFNTVAAKLFQVESNGGTAGASFIRSSNDGGSVDLVLGKSRSASVGGNTVVQSADAVGSISFQGNDGSEFVPTASITAFVDGTPAADDMPGRLVFSTTPSGSATPVEHMRVTKDGNVLIGCQSLPSATVEGFVATGTNSGNRTSSGSSTSSYNHWVFYNGNGIVGSIATDGSATSYNTSSDYRLKENVVPLTGAADRIKQLKPSKFNFIADPDKTVDGFIAHEAQEVVPECATGTKDEVDDEGNPVYQGIDQSKLVPLLTAALQEAMTRIEQLEAKVAAMENA